MTKEIEILDALPGCGKTTSIFRYMSENQSNPWIYLSPLKDEINERVQEEADKNSMEFFRATEDNDFTMTEQVLEALQGGVNVACTHALMMRFQKEHIDAIRENKYNIVCDEELNLISGYALSKEDIDFLIKHNLITVSDKDGKVSFTDSEMSLDARYGEVKQLCDMECLFSAKRSNKMLVTQLSSRLITASERFILLTYNYNGSIMQTFMQMHGFVFKEISDVKLFKTEKDIKQKLISLIELVETPSIKKIQQKYALSKSWWINASKEERKVVTKAMKSVVVGGKFKNDDVFFTLPKNCVIKATNSKIEVISSSNLPKSNFVACNTRATNKLAHKKLGIHAYNLFPNTAVKSYMQDMGYTCNDDVYALNMLLQWIFRGCIRKDEKMKVAILAKKMSILFKNWLEIQTIESKIVLS